MNFPMYADIYYPIITQGLYNDLQKQWIFDRTVVCNAISVTERDEEIGASKNFIQTHHLLEARTKEDIRISSIENPDASTNILIANIRFSDGTPVYYETSGSRANKSTLFEVAKLQPFIGAFNTIEYYKMIWRRAESQAVLD